MNGILFEWKVQVKLNDDQSQGDDDFSLLPTNICVYICLCS